MKKYFNGQGTISGTASLLRTLVAAIVYGVAVTSAKTSEFAAFMVIPAVAFYVWLMLSTQMKRLQAFGWTGRWYNLLFPALTDATYPNGKQSEE